MSLSRLMEPFAERISAHQRNLKTTLSPSAKDVKRRLIAIASQERSYVRVDLDKARAEERIVGSPRLLALGSFASPVQPPYGTGDTFGAPRSGGRRHEGIDIFAPTGTPVVATVDGRIREVGITRIGGRIVYLLSADGTYYYYAHLDRFAVDIKAGRSVVAGEILGFVGNTGNAEKTPPHLHFEIHPAGGRAVDPYPLIRAVERGDRAALARLTVSADQLCRTGVIGYPPSPPTTRPAPTSRPRKTTAITSTVAPSTVAPAPTQPGPPTKPPPATRPPWPPPVPSSIAQGFCR